MTWTSERRLSGGTDLAAQDRIPAAGAFYGFRR